MKLPRGNLKYLRVIIFIGGVFIIMHWIRIMLTTVYPHGKDKPLGYNIRDVKRNIHLENLSKLKWGSLDDQNLDVDPHDFPRNVSGYVHVNLTAVHQSSSVVRCTDGGLVRTKNNFVLEEAFDVGRSNVQQTETDEHRKRSFQDIFLNGEWGNKTKDTIKSGPGSAYSNTQNVRDTLAAVLEHIKRDLNKTTLRMLDIPCGDFTWMRHFLSDRNDVIYTGIDLVPELIDELNKEHRNQNNIQFKRADIVTDRLNDAYDLVFCRHMIQHLSDYDTVKVLENFSKSKSAYLLITTYPSWNLNTDLMYGGKFRFRAQNLETPPYSLAPPICMRGDGDKDLTALWRLPLKQVKNCLDPPVDKYVKDRSGRRHYSCG